MKEVKVEFRSGILFEPEILPGPIKNSVQRVRRMLALFHRTSKHGSLKQDHLWMKMNLEEYETLQSGHIPFLETEEAIQLCQFFDRLHTIHNCYQQNPLKFR